MYTSQECSLNGLINPDFSLSASFDCSLVGIICIQALQSLSPKILTSLRYKPKCLDSIHNSVFTNPSLIAALFDNDVEVFKEFMSAGGCKKFNTPHDLSTLQRHIITADCLADHKSLSSMNDVEFSELNDDAFSKLTWQLAQTLPKASWKGFRVGQLSKIPKLTGAIVNEEEFKASDVCQLIAREPLYSTFDTSMQTHIKDHCRDNVKETNVMTILVCLVAFLFFLIVNYQ